MKVVVACPQPVPIVVLEPLTGGKVRGAAEAKVSLTCGGGGDDDDSTTSHSPTACVEYPCSSNI